MEKFDDWLVEISDAGESPGFGIIRVEVEGMPGLPVQLSTADWKGYSRRTGSKPEFGPYAMEFSPLGDGLYIVQPEGVPFTIEVNLQTDRIALIKYQSTVEEEPEELEPKILPPATGWTYEVEDGGPAPGFGIVRVSVEGKAGLPVRIWSDGWPGMVRRSGEKQEYGEFACEFAPLGAGAYFIEPAGLDIQAEVVVDGSSIIWVTFDKGVQVEMAGVSVPVAEKRLDRCLLVGAMPWEREDYLILLRYVAQFQPVITVSLSDALAARHVIILGSELTVSAEDEAQLVAAGAAVERIRPEEIVAKLQEFLDEN